jgi:hypothetical protein
VKRALLIALALSFAACDAMAVDLTGRHREGRAFWLNGQAVPAPIVTDRPQRKFTTTYVDGVISRFSNGTGHMDFFERQLGERGGFTPQFAGTVDGGGAKLVLRWHPGE